MRRRALAGLMAVLALPGCGGGGSAGSGFEWVGEAGPDSVEGRVRVVGNRPFTRTVVEPEAGEALTIEGPYRVEIGRLAGAVVRVSGRRGDGQGMGPTLDASAYEVVSVDGDRPRLGVLVREAERYVLRTPGGSTVRLEHVSGPLAGAEGALVWVVLDEKGGVARYGILRAPR